ncbi:phosphatase PAP2 family protein [Fulvivirga ulvae]|uniref:phosphatase PAP2 family protein n=1 Tax=Fulvivirga ulvae TaxID=2904245 RepID=UPI001F443BD8|nr:phosphatase PAP2 family protein [Fulvivirga ulvae]UII30293.1 phosphatase PAP2 family protein [Fulvivirga ulvae]
MTRQVANLVLVILISAQSITHAQTSDSLAVPKKKWHQTNLVKVAGIPIVLTGLGLAASNEGAPVNRFKVQRGLAYEFPDFSSTLDDYMRYGPPAAVYALDFFGVKSKNSFKHKTLIFLKANIMGFGLAFPLKGITKVRRPDESSSASFPSLHTVQAFIGATFMHKELGHRSPWYSIGAYTVATATGFYRMLNNKHWLSDVMVGAAIGILSTNVAYITHQYKDGNKKKKGQVRAFITPAISSKSYGAAVVLLIR